MTVNQLALEMMLELDVQADVQGFTTQFEAWINDSLSQIASRANWRFFQVTSPLNTVATQAVYSLPIGVKEIRQMRHVVTNEPVEFKPQPTLAYHGLDLELPGKPTVWTPEGSTVDGSGNVLYTIRLWPVPNDIFNLEFTALYHPEAIASGSHLPVQPQYIEIIRDRVRAFHYARLKEWEGSNLHYVRFRDNLQNLVEMEQRKPANRTRLQVRDISRGAYDERAKLPPDQFHN